MNAMNIKLIKYFGILMMVLGFAVAPDRVLGQASELETTLVSLGYTIQQKAKVEATSWEKSEFSLQDKQRYAIKSVKPVSGERALYYRFTVDVETYLSGTDAEKRLERIEATPPGVDSKMQPEYVLREGFRREKLVYVVSTDVYKFVLDKDLTRLREKLDQAIRLRKQGIHISHIPARRGEAVEASRILEGAGFHVSLYEYPAERTGGVELIYYPRGSKSEARKIAKGLNCIVSNVTVTEGLHHPAMAGIDYSLGFWGDKAPQPTADESRTQDALCFASPQAAIAVITELLRKEDWKTLTRYYDLSNFNTPRSELESGRFFIHDKRPDGAHPGLPWKYKHPFAPGFKFVEAKETDDPNVVRVRLNIEIDEGGGLVQRGFSEFKMRKSDQGYQLLPPDGAPAQTDRAEYAEVLRRIALKIEALGRTYPHLARFSIEKNVRGLKLEPELRILYYNGVRDVPNPRYETGRKVSKLIPAYAEADGIELILNLMTEEQADSGQKVVSRKTMIGNRVVDLIVEGENTRAIKEIRAKIGSIIQDEKAHYESRHAKHVAVPGSASQKQDALYFASPQEAVPITTELLRKEDWKTLSKYYDLSGRSKFKTPRSELESGRFFIQDKRPEGAHPGLPWKYKHPFTPGFKFDRAEETYTYLVTVIVKIRIDEGGGMVQQGFSEFLMRKSSSGYQLLSYAPEAAVFWSVPLSDETQSDSPISARVVHEEASLIVGRPAQNLKVAIRNNTATTDPRQGVAIVLRGVHWAGDGEDTRQWLKQLGRTEGSFDKMIILRYLRAGVTDLAFETGLILPGKEIIVTAPLTSGQGGKHELVVRYAVVGGDGKDWSGEVLVQTVLPAYNGAWFEPATPVRRLSGATNGIVRSTSKPGASPLPIQQTIIPLQLPVVLDPESAREKAAELAGVALELEKYYAFYCAPQQAWFFVLVDGSGVALRRRVSTAAGIDPGGVVTGYKWEAEPLPKRASASGKAPHVTEKELCPR